MDISKLIAIGFSRNAASVYNALLGYGTADAKDIIKKTKMHKKLVYENLEWLMNEGLVTFIEEKGRRVFEPAPPHMLLERQKEEEQKLAAKHKVTESIVKDIEALERKRPLRQNARILRGIKGVKTHYAEMLEKTQTYAVLGAPQESLKIMGDTFWKNLNVKLKAKKIKGRLLFNSSLKDYGKTIQNTWLTVRYLDIAFEPLTETILHGDWMAMIVWTEDPLVIIIEDKTVAQSYLQFFERLWKQAKK